MVAAYQFAVRAELAIGFSANQEFLPVEWYNLTGVLTANDMKFNADHNFG
ncbi:MAG: hypothetical protein RIK87_19690 [Fuerstiella sp.]